MKNTVGLIFTKKMMFLNMELLWSGVSIAFWSGVLIPILVLLQDKGEDMPEMHKHFESLALYAMCCFGLGEVLGGAVQGQIIDNLGSKAGCLCNILSVCLCVSLTVVSISSGELNIVAYLMCFFWGFHDGNINIHVFQTLGFEFVS